MAFMIVLADAACHVCSALDKMQWTKCNEATNLAMAAVEVGQQLCWVLCFLGLAEDSAWVRGVLVGGSVGLLLH